jgi:SAM-dependent methyltransferase
VKSSDLPGPDALLAAMQRVVDRRIISKGEVVFPCVPGLLETYVDKLARLFLLLGRESTEEELSEARRILGKALELGHERSPRTRVIVQWEAHSARPLPQLKYVVAIQERSLEEHYAEVFERETGALFGVAPDAKLLSVAAELGDPAATPVLDVGAGTGRNAIALARRGHPVTALEPVPVLCDELCGQAAAEGLALGVIRGDLLSSEVVLDPAAYRLVLLSQVLSELTSVSDMQHALEKVCGAVAPGGLLLFNTFLPQGGYTPDELAREISTVARATIYTREELRFITANLAFELVSDESVYEFERAHQPAASWPPTPWFESWARGRNVFDLDAERCPTELRWLLYRR